MSARPRELQLLANKHSNLSFKIFFMGYTVAIETCYVKKMTITCLPMTGHTFHFIICQHGLR